ncbi:MAG TPA: hypothetical protein VFS43_11625 [Polyangiaceae bacterium]|nr:hypothetical protein [Polyangiaceae bacterium]
MLLAPGALPGCGGDSAPPPPPPELSLSMAPTASWCCPGFAPLDGAGAPCPLVAVEAPGAPYGAAPAFVSSLDVQAVDARTGLAVTIAPPGRCVSVGGPCGHLAVTVRDGAGEPVVVRNEAGEPVTNDRQQFGSGSFELLVSAAETGPETSARQVRVELRGDDGQPLLDPLGAPVAAELSFAVFTARRSRPAQGGEVPQEAQPAQSAAEVCPRPAG